MSIFGGTLKPYTIRQLLTRQALLSTEGARPMNVQLYTGGKTAWVKMSSFVDYADKPGEPPTSALARKYMLEGGAMLQDPSNPEKFALRAGVGNANGSYGSNLGNRQLGLRPIPGITSVNVTNKGAYGSLRLTTIKFKAWDKKQLDDLEILYMRTGFPVLVEWGWSMYLDTSTDQDKDFTSVSNYGDININSDSIAKFVNKPIKSFTDPTINAFDSKGDQEYFYNELLKLSHRFSGNYDGMVGLIQNFTWELLPNGSYDCTTILVSMGDTLDSIKMNRPSTNSIDSTGSEYKTSFSDLMGKLVTKRGDKDQAIRYADPIVQSAGVVWLERYANVIRTEQDKSTYPSYIKLSKLVELIRTQFGLLEKGGKPFINIEVPEYNLKGNRGNGLCLASVDSVSVDPTVCLIGNPKASWVTGDADGFNIKYSNGESALDPFLCPDENYKYSSLGQIGNIYVNIQYLTRVFNDTLNSSKDGEVHMYSFLKSVMQDISNAIGGINDFDVFVEDNKAVIIDKNYTELSSQTSTSNKFQINIFGTDTVVRSFKIVSKIFQSQANMIAIAAGNNRLNLGGVNTSTQQYFNAGISNRLVPKLTTEEQADNYNNEHEAKLNWAANVLDLRAYLQSFLVKKSFPSSGDAVAFARTALNSVILNVNSDANYRSVIPIQVELTLDGISGITNGEVFRINTDMIPKEYSRKDVGFIVRNVQHNIVKSDWTTTIEAYMVLLNQIGKSNKDNSLSDNDKNKIDVLFEEVVVNSRAKYDKYNKAYKSIMWLIRAYYENAIKMSYSKEKVYYVNSGRTKTYTKDNRPDSSKEITFEHYNPGGIGELKVSDPFYLVDHKMIGELNLPVFDGKKIHEAHTFVVKGEQVRVEGDVDYIYILNHMLKEGRENPQIHALIREMITKTSDYKMLSEEPNAKPLIEGLYNAISLVERKGIVGPRPDKIHAPGIRLDVDKYNQVYTPEPYSWLIEYVGKIR